MVKKCLGKNDENNSNNSYASIILKSFVVLTCILLFAMLKKKLLTEDLTIFYLALFIVLGTIILSLIGITDTNIFNNILIGLGIAIGMKTIEI